MTPKPAIALLAAFAFALPPQKAVIGPIDFFGQSGIDEARLRAALTVHPGDEITHENWGASKAKLRAALKSVAGKDPTEIATVCCDPQGHILLYIGIPGLTVKPLHYRPVPMGSALLPADMLKLEDEYDRALTEGIEKGQAAEDDSKGYAVNAYPPLRSVQLDMRKRALANEPLIRRVLATARNSRSRAFAAQLMGYVKASPSQIQALVDAMRDTDEAVRNNAVRALGVMVHANRSAAKSIPPDFLIDMLHSGTWTDRNKSGMLLDGMTYSRNPALLSKLRARALPSLIEMARWKDPGHAGSFRMILGRIAGIEETRLAKLSETGDLKPILDALHNAQRRP